VSVGQAASKQGVSVGQARLAARKVNGVRLAGSECGTGKR
jgi:hypothetical protein